MQGFLASLAAHLYEVYGDKISDQMVIFPNRRAGIFFNNYLNRQVSQPIFSPEIVTISDFFASQTDLHVADPLTLVFYLYEIYREVTGSSESFDDFYFWGDMLVNDFDDIDKYNVNAAQLFQNISDLKEIDLLFQDYDEEHREHLTGFWRSLSNREKTPNQSEFLRIWQSLYPVYEKFGQRLRDEGIAYEGMVYRDTVQRIRAKKLELKHGGDIILAGFNALNRCEELLFGFFRETGKAKFYWDYDRYYLDDPQQEAGLFMRKNLKNFPQAASLGGESHFMQHPPHIEIINVPSQVGQAQVASNRLMKIPVPDRQFDDTAVVLCDEGLLLPVLGALPQQIGKVNVTMGFPVNASPAYSLVNQLIELQRNIRHHDGTVFYYKNVLALLGHQLISGIEPEWCRKLTEEIISQNMVYLPVKKLQRTSFLRQIFEVPDTIETYSDYFLQIIRSVFTGLPSDENENRHKLHKEYLFQLYLAVNRLKDVLETRGKKVLGNKDFLTRETYFRFLSQHLGGITVPFEGEPLQGLQVMGILETRTLDFRNLVILSMNDGVMPKTSAKASFIPYNLRRGFGLPSIEEMNAMYAYYFYRLLQRAENVTFVYHSGTDGLFVGEKSRYLYQLQMETSLEIKETSVSMEVSTLSPLPVTVQKTAEVMLPLQPYLDGTRALSPSAIDKYLTCPLQFYFRYCAGLEEPDEVTEEVDARIFGNLFHDTMEALYSPFLGKEVIPEAVQHLMDDELKIQELLLKSFRRNYFKGGEDGEPVVLRGRNWLVGEIVKKYIRKVLELDKKRAPFIIEGLEEKFKAGFTLTDGKRNVLVGGKVDRIDKRNGALEILDYKTGKAELSFTMLDDLFDHEKTNRNKAALQTLIYAAVVHANRKSELVIQTGIYALRRIFEKDFQPVVTSKELGNQPVNYVEHQEVFNEKLLHLLDEIFDVTVPFVQTEKEETCRYCAYKNICRRG